MNIFMLLTPKKNVTFLTTEMSIEQALELLKIVRFSSVPLLDHEGRYVGTISEGDLLWHLDEKGYEQSLITPLGKVKRVRDYNPVSINATLDALMGKSLSQNFMPILDDRGYFIGIVTRSDILNHFLAEINYRTITEPQNAVLKALYERRSIRKFSDEKIKETVIKEILDSSLIAPTAANRQANHFYFIDDAPLIKTISETHIKGGQFAQAPYLILVLNDTSKEPNENNALANCSAATMSLLLAIHSFETIGGFWIAARDKIIIN